MAHKYLRKRKKTRVTLMLEQLHCLTHLTIKLGTHKQGNSAAQKQQADLGAVWLRIRNSSQVSLPFIERIVALHHSWLRFLDWFQKVSWKMLHCDLIFLCAESLLGREILPGAAQRRKENTKFYNYSSFASFKSQSEIHPRNPDFLFLLFCQMQVY